MPRSLDYFFTIASPWAYLGHELMRAITDKHGVRINYRPMPIRDVFDRTGSLPLPQRPPARQRYRLVELQRWREKRGLSLHLRPAHVPFDANLANCAALVLALKGHDPHHFAGLAFAGVFAEERNLGDAAVIAELLTQAGHDADSTLAAATSEAVKAAYAQNGDDAVAADVFGAPGYVLDGEVFWGQDRLELLDDALSTKRRAYTPV
ncbi:MAG: 2-hydroxychromene-2-carboxylate isomerase [Bosea sp. (in: a-proteobacteria)]